MKILIMGLPGSGKTWLATRLQEHLDCAWFNADEMRSMANDWEFSEDARIRQARRMTNIADYEKGCGRTVICDFVCPTELTRFIYDADITIWMDTIKASLFKDTNKMFEPPTDFDYIIEEFMDDEQIKLLASRIKETYGI